MRKLIKSRIQQILSDELALKDPVFHLKAVGGRILGSVVSATFRGKGDNKRQCLIWDALDKELGPESVKLVGMILAYTPDEWQSDMEVAHPRAKSA